MIRHGAEHMNCEKRRYISGHKGMNTAVRILNKLEIGDDVKIAKVKTNKKTRMVNGTVTHKGERMFLVQYVNGTREMFSVADLTDGSIKILEVSG